MYFADRLSAAINPDLNNKFDSENTGKDVYSFEFTDGEFKSMSPVYDSDAVTMETVLDYMWQNDNSGVFEFDSLTMRGLETKERVLTVMVSSGKIPEERTFCIRTFSKQTISHICKLTQCNVPIIRIGTKKVEEDLMVKRRLFSWK